MKFLENVGVRLMRMPEICGPLGWRCVHFHTADPVLKTRLTRKSLVIIVSLMSDNSDISKINFVVVFVDMAGDLELWSNIETALLCSQSEF